MPMQVTLAGYLPAHWPGPARAGSDRQGALHSGAAASSGRPGARPWPPGHVRPSLASLDAILRRASAAQLGAQPPAGRR